MAVLGVLGLLRRHRWAVVALALACAVVLAGQDLDLLPERGALFVRFFTVFLAGVLAQLYGDRLVLRRLDHANIFLITAGTYTPLAVLMLRTDQAVLLLSVL